MGTKKTGTRSGRDMSLGKGDRGLSKKHGKGAKEAAMIAPDHFMPLFSELEEECLGAIKLIRELRNVGLSAEKKDEILGDLSVSITSLHISTELLDEELEGLESIVL